MSDGSKEVEEQKENEIPICADGWLAVFHLISPRQLGLQIALLSHRFDCYVDEHFKKRRWTFGVIRIEWKKGENGTKEMQIVNSKGQQLPIPQNQPPKKVVGFELIFIKYFDRNVIIFLHRHFRRLFASYGINLAIYTNESEFVARTIWPMISSNICGFEFYSRYGRHFATSIFISNKYPSLRYVSSFVASFPPNGAVTSEGQALVNWLFTPRPDGLPKMLRCQLRSVRQQASRIGKFKAAFANASTCANFIVSIKFSCLEQDDSIEPFELINHLTGERLTMKRYYNESGLLVRCPIARDEQKWAKWEEEAKEWHFYNQWNRIEIL